MSLSLAQVRHTWHHSSDLFVLTLYHFEGTFNITIGAPGLYNVTASQLLVFNDNDLMTKVRPCFRLVFSLTL